VSALLSSLLIVASIKGTLLLVFAAGICFLAKRSSAAARHQIWALAIVAIVMLPVLLLTLPGWHAPAVSSTSKIWRSAITNTLLTTSPGDSVTLVKGSSQVSPATPWRTWMVAVWLIGIGFVLQRLAYGIARLRSIAAHATPLSNERLLHSIARCSHQLGVSRPVHVLIAADPRTMPCTWGLVKPQILLPASALMWSAERFEMVITHELAHVQRWDWPMRLTAEAARAIFWFHPLVWLAVSQLRQESESACDDTVLNSGQAPTTYAAELLDLVRNATRYPAAALTVAARKSNFERRFTSMLNPNVNRSRLKPKIALLTTAAACLGLFSLASVRAPAQDIAGLYTGLVVDSHGTAVTNATVELTNSTTHQMKMTATSATGSYQFSGLPSGEYDVRVEREGFDASKSHESIDSARNSPAMTTLSPLGTAGNITEANSAKVKIGSNVESANRIRNVTPFYPASAKASGIQGSVILAAVIDKLGAPISLRVQNIDVDPELARSAIEAASQWRYKPTLLNGNPIEVATTITVNYTLSE
jgi:TonB family protein